MRPRVHASEVTEIAEPLWRQWSQLAETAAEPNAFAEPWFVAASLRHLASGPVRLLAVRDGDALTGLLLLGVEPRYGRIPIAHVENWRHPNLFLGTPLIRSGQEEPFWRAVIEALDRASWASGFLHLTGLVEGGTVHDALTAAATDLGRPCATVHRESRAFLESNLDAQAYYEATVRKKKRKELGRLKNRLAELGPLTTRELAGADDLAAWCDAFLELEMSGWKGREGSALACRPHTEGFFRETLAAACAAGRLQFLRLDLEHQPIAMLVNFLTPPGAFSFKTAFDEAYARFSPGVLLQLDNLSILERPDIAWMDSCAAAEHPMIDSLWAERRSVIRVTVPLAGIRRRLAFTGARALEEAAAARRRLVARTPQTQDEQS